MRPTLLDESFLAINLCDPPTKSIGLDLLDVSVVVPLPLPLPHVSFASHCANAVLQWGIYGCLVLDYALLLLCPTPREQTTTAGSMTLNHAVVCVSSVALFLAVATWYNRSIPIYYKTAANAAANAAAAAITATTADAVDDGTTVRDVWSLHQPELLVVGTVLLNRFALYNLALGLLVVGSGSMLATVFQWQDHRHGRVPSSSNESVLGDCANV
jgi:hypothetical protein